MPNVTTTCLLQYMMFWYYYIWQEQLKRQNTLGCLDQYAAQNSEYARTPIPSQPQPKRSSSSGTLNMIPSWNIHTVKQSMPRSCSNGCSLNWFTEWGKFWLWSSTWPWRSRSIAPQNNRNLNQCILHLWSKFSYPTLNEWWVMVWTNSKSVFKTNGSFSLAD